MKNKNGSHVGVIVSFTVFILFLVFLYSILQPAIQTRENKQGVLDYLKPKIIQAMSAEMTSGTIVIPENAFEETEKECFEIERIGEGNAIVKKDNSEVQSKSKQEILKIKNNVGLLWIYYSKEFEQGNLQGECEFLEKENYDIGIVKTKKYLFFEKITKFKDDYNLDYDKLKEDLEIPIGNEFGFIFTDDQNNQISAGIKNLTTNIYVEEVPVQYIKNKKINFGILSIRVW